VSRILSEKRLQIDLAPVGRAFASAQQQHPEIALQMNDGAHPSIAGSYLAACVLYATLTHLPVTSVQYAPRRIPAAEANVLRELAAELAPP
jgi:hypothetical protein